MKRAIYTALLLTLAAWAFAQEPTPQNPPAPAGAPKEPGGVEGPASAPAAVDPLFSNRLGTALQAFDVDTESSKFEEYRTVPEGVAGPDLRLFNESDAVRLLVTGTRIAHDDRRFDVNLEHAWIGAEAFYDEIPHRLGSNTGSILNRTAKESWEINDLVQQSLQSAIEARRAQSPASVNFAFLNTLVQPLLAAPYIYDLGFDRKRGGLTLQFFPAASLDTRVSYFREKRFGTRPAGTSFGFGNVVETGEPIDYVTEEAGIRMELPLARGLVRGGLVVNQFTNQLLAYNFDNPFRFTDSTDPNAYQAPGSASINGPRFGRMSLGPDSSQLVATIGGVYKLPARSRLTADVVFGHLTSNDRLIPFTTNTAIVTPDGHPATDPAALPTGGFDGEINSLSATLSFNSRPIANLGLNVRLRHYDLSNESERVRFEGGYVRFDSVWEDIPRITVPYGWTNTRLDLFATYDLGVTTLEAGFRHDSMERTFRETEETRESTFRLATDIRPVSWAVLRASYESGSRDLDRYDPDHGEHASFLDPGPLTNLPELRRFDQAERDTSRMAGMLQLMPIDALMLSANYIRYFDDYTGASTHGLLNWRNESLSLEADYTPAARWNVFAFFTHDEWSTFQRGRQSGATPNRDPADDWTSHHIDKGNTFGLGTSYAFIPERLSLRLNGSVQKVSGYNNLESPPGGSIVGIAVDIPSIDDTSLSSAAAELTYAMTSAWHFAVGAWMEDYEIFDMLSTGTRPYMPGAFFLVPNDGNYRGSAFYIRSTYTF
jgi:hypothetical protein